MTSHPPIRTCLGCRSRVPAAELLRVVVATDAIGGQLPVGEGTTRPATPVVATPVVPDPRRRAAGRGAWVHRTPGCVETAVRRRAFARALRVPGPVDPAPVLALVALDGTSSTGSATVHHHQRNPAGDDEQ